MSSSIGQLWRSGRDALAARGVDGAALDARLLAQHVLGLDATGLIAQERDPAPPESEPVLMALVSRRAAGEPVARILGHKEFYGLDFALNPDTLVPRPETEMLVDFALSVLEAEAEATLLDLGTGTGCIPIAVLVHRRHVRAVAVDLSETALAQATANAAAHGVAPRFTPRVGSWFDPVGAARFDLVVSNPPYIETAAMAGLATEVRTFDPALALDGGPDGLGPYRSIAAGLDGHLALGGRVALEIGTGQGQSVAALLAAEGLEDVMIHADLSGHQRMVTARRRRP